MTDPASGSAPDRRTGAGTTAESELTPEMLDALVPPPMSRTVRASAWGVFTLLVVGIGWAWVTGAVTPRVSWNGGSYGGDGPVHLGLQIESDSSVDLEITDGYDTPPGLRLLGFTTSPGSIEASAAAARTDIFPIRLGPDDIVHLTAFYEVEDCAVLEAYRDPITVEVEIADGPFSLVSRRREVGDSLISGGGVGEALSWPASIAEFVCPVPGVAD